MRKEPAKAILLLNSGTKLYVRDPYQKVKDRLYDEHTYLNLTGTEGNQVFVAVSQVAALVEPVKG